MGFDLKMQTVKYRALVYSHDLKCDDIFFTELEKTNLDINYLIANENTQTLKKFTELKKDLVVHELYDLRRGVFPEEVEEFFKKSKDAIDYKILQYFEPHYFDLLLECSRIDGTGFAFSFEQRWELIKELILKLQFVLKYYQIELVIIKHVPHFPSEHILFYLCKFLNIPVTFRVEISGSRNAYYATGIMEKHLPLNMYMDSHPELVSIPDNDKYFDQIQSNYDVAIPAEIKQQESSKEKNSNPINLLKQFLLRLPGLSKKLFENTKITIKVKSLPFKDPKSGMKYWQLIYYFIKARRKIKSNQKIYESMVIAPDLKSKYIFFSSSYQPERTTCPDSGYYGDLLLIVDMLSRSIPKDWIVYYKEHPTNFMPPDSEHFYRGHMFRSKEFFEKLNSYENVKLVSFTHDNFELIDNAQAVASATGTTSWEAVIRGVPGLIFGNAWFEGCGGTQTIRNQEDLVKAIANIKNNKIDLEKIKLYRQSFLEVSRFCPTEDKHMYSQEDYAKKFAEFVVKTINELSDMNLLDLKKGPL